jgi:pimeloyl-ACP methyl ester carboxylesterase
MAWAADCGVSLTSQAPALWCPAEECMEIWREVAGEGPPVLKIHEGICDSRMWESQWLPQAHRTVRYDLRGFSQTPLPAEHYSNARDVVELLDRLELGPAGLVGVSLGGRVTLEVALARPDLVERVVLIVGLPGHPWSEIPPRTARHEDATGSTKVPWLRAQSEFLFPSGVSGMLEPLRPCAIRTRTDS